MLTLDPTMTHLAADSGVPFLIPHTKYVLDAEANALQAAECVIDDSEEAFRCGENDEGVRLACWTPYLLAAIIGYDGFVVQGLGRVFAQELSRPDNGRSQAGFSRVGEALGIHNPGQYLTQRTNAETADDLWCRSLHQITHGTRPFGLRLAFWAAYIRATEFDPVAVGVSEAAVCAADMFRAFACRPALNKA